MYNQFQNSSFQNIGSTGFTASQYRGNETRYQPVGYVQSQYSGSIAQNAYGSQFQTPFNQNAQYHSGTQNIPQPYHTASYRGNQPGHDAYLRADSVQPAQSQGMGMAGFGNQGSASGWNQNVGISNQFQPSYSSFHSGPQPYHTANYRGNQPGHDNQLRADSVNPAQSQFGIGMSSFSSIPSSQYHSPNQNQFGAGSFGFNAGRQF